MKHTGKSRDFRMSATDGTRAGQNAGSLQPPRYGIEFVDDGLSAGAPAAASAMTVQARPAVAVPPEPRPGSSRIPAPALQRKCAACEEEEKEEKEEEPLQRKAFAGWPVENRDAGPTQAAGLQGESQVPVRLPGHGGGAEMPRDVRARMEAAFGVEFSPVRIHEGPHARAIGALAYTQGTDIHFAPGQYQPRSQRGQELLGHELTHVVQQSQGRVRATTQAKGVDINDDAVLEREADEMGTRVARGEEGHKMPHKLGGMSLDGSVTQQTVQDVALKFSTLADNQQNQVIQQGAAGHEASLGTIQRALDCGDVAADQAADDQEDPYELTPDDERVDRSIEWPKACQSNVAWWHTLQLPDVQLIRDLDPERQPRAWANRTLSAQRLLYERGIRQVAGARLRRDGILGPRTLLALRQVALDNDHPARAELQGLGFDLDAIIAASAAARRAEAEAVRAEFLLQVSITPLGESAVRYYDLNFYMVHQDRDILDHLLFGGSPPEGIRREDRIELLRRLYGQESQRLDGTVALVRASRDFIHRLVDITRAVERDNRRHVDRRYWFTFFATDREQVTRLDRYFEFAGPMQRSYERVSRDRRADVDEALTLLRTDLSMSIPARREIAAILIAVYVPELAPERRTSIVEEYMAEKREREQREREAIDTHNREVIRQRADRLAALITADDMYRPTRMGRILDELELNLRDISFFEMVLDDLSGRPGNLFVRLYDVVEGLNSQRALRALVELSLAGRHAEHARVRRALGVLNRRHSAQRRHVYIAGDSGAVLLDGSDRLAVGQVAGAVNSAYLRDETKERLKPEAEERLNAELERQARSYMAGVNEGTEPARTQDKIGELLLQRAWQAAGLDVDRDVEEIEIEESIRLLGVRRQENGSVGSDGIERYDVDYEVVRRIVGYTDWEPVADSGGWRGEDDFENRLFWYSYSQSADFVITASKIVAFGAVAVVAWEVGVIGALVQVGGGALPVGLSIGISVAIYMLTHERWTLEGLLLAGLEGYLSAVGFRIFSPVGLRAARLVLPQTLEQVAFRRVVAAWLLRHGTTGALTGVTTGPAMLFAQDLVRVLGHGGSFSSWGAYLRTAGYGLVLGAAFEIAGSALLGPLFRTADKNVLSSLTEVVGRLRGAGISPSQWMAEAAGALSNVRTWLAGHLDDAISQGLYDTFRRAMRETGESYLRGLRLTIHRQVLELTEAALSREAVDGLERVLRTGSATLDDTALTNILRHAGRTPERVGPWLRFLDEIDDALLDSLIQSNRLQALADSAATLALVGRRSSQEVAALLTGRFNGSLTDLEAFATRVSALDADVGDRVLELLRTRGTAVTPEILIHAAEGGVSLGDDVIAGLARLMQTSPNRANLQALIQQMPRERLEGCLTTARTASAQELRHLHGLTADPPRGGRLLGFAQDVPQLITLLDTVNPALITDLDAFLARSIPWSDNANRNLMQLLLQSPTTAEAGQIARRAMSVAEMEGVESLVILAGRQRANVNQLLDLSRSLEDAIALRAGDPTAAIEVNYYAGTRRSAAEIRALRAAPGFDRKLHVNIDVVTSTQRREWKRVNVPVTRSNFLKQVTNAADKFVALGLPRRSLGGTHEHVGLVDYGDFLDPSFTPTTMRQRVLDEAARNQELRRHVDTIILYYNISSSRRQIEIIIPPL